MEMVPRRMAIPSDPRKQNETQRSALIVQALNQQKYFHS